MNKEVLHKAIDLLSRREHAVVELEKKLKSKDYELSDISEVIRFLIEKDYVSDRRYTETMIRSRTNKGYGWRYIQQELSHKGVVSSLISEVLEELEIDWYAVAADTYQRKFSMKSITDHKDKAKRIRFMQYRGFTSDIIFSVIENEQTDLVDY